MAPDETDTEWALRNFLEVQTRAIEEFDASLDKVSDNIIETKTLIESTIKTLTTMLKFAIGSILLLAGIKVAEIVGLIG